jgi:hypothetical protein
VSPREAFPHAPADALDRFMEKVSVRSGACWLWTAGVTNGGYPRFSYGGKTRLAHRVAYKWATGDLSETAQIDHVKARGCISTRCVNPAHLEAVSPRENVLRSAAPSAVNAAKTHCVRGHELTFENTMRRNGSRICRTCQRAAASAWALENREHINAKKRERAAQKREAA